MFRFVVIMLSFLTSMISGDLIRCVNNCLTYQCYVAMCDGFMCRCYSCVNPNHGRLPDTGVC